MEAIVLAGGFGTRLNTIVQDVPKPMAPVAGRPFLEYILDDLIQHGVTRIILAVHYKKECIIDRFGDHYRGAEILYSVEETPLFTGGAVKKALTLCDNNYVFVINGDTYFQVSLKEMAELGEKLGASVTIAVKQMQHFSRYGKVDVNPEHLITEFHEKAPCALGYINGGIYYLERKTLESYPEAFSLETECFPVLLQKKQIAAFESKGYFIDIGVPEDFYVAQEYFAKAGRGI